MVSFVTVTQLPVTFSNFVTSSSSQLSEQLDFKHDPEQEHSPKGKLAF